MMEQVLPEETVVHDAAREDRICRLAQSRGLYLARAVDRYRLLDPKQNCAGVASGTLDEIEARLKLPLSPSA
jgi:hypothetical protein